MNCIKKFVPFPEIISPFFIRIIEIIFHLFNSSNRLILIHCCLLTKKFLRYSDEYPFTNDILNQFFNNIIKFIISCPPECDLNTDWEPHISAIATLFPLLKIIEIDLLSIINILINSENYGERFVSLIILTYILKNTNSVIFLHVLERLIQLINDPIPRIREWSIICISNGFTKMIMNNPQIPNLENITDGIFLIVKTHFNDIPNVSIHIYSLFYSIFQVVNMKYDKEMLELMLINLLNYENLITIKHFKIIRKMIKESHYCIISLFKFVFFLLVQSLTNYNWLVYDLSLIISCFIKRFQKDLSNYYEETSILFIQMFNSPINDIAISSIIPLSYISCFVVPLDKVFLQSVLQMYFVIYQRNNPIELNVLYHGIKQFLKMKLIPNEILPKFIEFQINILRNNEIPLITIIYTFETFLMSLMNFKELFIQMKNIIFQIIKYIFHNCSIDDISFTLISFMNSLNFLVEAFRQEEIDECSHIILKCISLCLKTQIFSYKFNRLLIKILMYFSENFPNELLIMFSDDNETFQEYFEMTSKDAQFFKEIQIILNKIGYQEIQEENTQT